MPDKKLEKVSKAKVRVLLKKHRLRMIVKLPEDTFFGIGITASIFVFGSGVPQDNEDIFGGYIPEDGLACNLKTSATRVRCSLPSRLRPPPARRP